MQRTVTQIEAKKMLTELSTMEMQILKLKSSLLPKVKASKKEIMALEEAKRDIRKGLGISGSQFVRELSKS
jgi:hypothetical protein